MGIKYGGLFEASELAIVRTLIREFQSRWWSIAYDPEEDLMQDLLLHWLLVRREFDPRRQRSRSAFMRQVLKNKLFSIVRERETVRRRADYHAVSLQQPLQGHPNSNLLDVIDEYIAAPCKRADDFHEREVHLDLITIINKLLGHKERFAIFLDARWMRCPIGFACPAPLFIAK